MRIAFDLDDTLIPCGHAFAVEKPTRLARLLSVEPIRQGSIQFLKDLRGLGCDLWVYTTSLRSPWSIYVHFLSYGIRLGGIVNYDRHRRRLAGGYPDPGCCSKYPPAYRIDLLFDDSEGVVQEGRQYGFRAVRLDPAKEDWTAVVRAEVKRWLER